MNNILEVQKIYSWEEELCNHRAYTYWKSHGVEVWYAHEFNYHSGCQKYLIPTFEAVNDQLNSLKKGILAFGTHFKLFHTDKKYPGTDEEYEYFQDKFENLIDKVVMLSIIYL